MSAINFKKYLCVSALMLSTGSTASGGQPPDVVSSDGNGNTAMGSVALLSLTTGTENTASGDAALQSNTTGVENTASGIAALQMNTTGEVNTALGSYALANNTTGVENTASGVSALYQNTTGIENTANGVNALVSNTIGNVNTAIGYVALFSNTTGGANTATGYQTLFSSTTGSNNTAAGVNALYSSTSGSGNIAFGANAGYNLTTGNNNIDIANQGVAGESGTIRIGDPNAQSATYIAGIWGRRVHKGASVVVNSSGQLGIEESSERYKTDIVPMDPSSEKILQLRPVKYRLKADPAGEQQYGLIAEEVDQVYPELVVRDDAGNIEGVRYDRFAPILLREVQQQQLTMAAQTRQLVELKEQLAELRELNRTMHVALIQLQAKDTRIVMR
jgi:hypothetical protein